MKILVLGSNGLLGQKLIKILSDDSSVDVVAASLGKNRIPDLIQPYFEVDISKLGDVQKTINEVSPEVVINTAAMTNVDHCELNKQKCWEVNVTGPDNIAMVCEKIGSHLIQISTDFIFNGKKGPLDEEADPDPVNYYGESKLESERIIQSSNLNWTILRTVLVYGWSNNLTRSNIVLWIKESLENGDNIRLVNDQFRTPTLAEDLAIGCYLSASKNQTGIFHISGKDFLTPFQMGKSIANYFNLDESLIEETNSHEFQQPAIRPMRTGFIIEKAKSVLGYEPRSFEDGLGLINQQMEA